MIEFTSEMVGTILQDLEVLNLRSVEVSRVDDVGVLRVEVNLASSSDAVGGTLAHD